jgi:serine/threonine-protein kinase HipA
VSPRVPPVRPQSKAGTDVNVFSSVLTQAVTAGRFELTKDRRGASLGRFVYGKSYRYLARGNAAIDPVELKLSGETYENGPS